MNPFQAVALLLTFVLLAGVGGVLAAGLVIPVAAGASALTEGTADAFYELPEDLEPGQLSEASYVYARDGVTLLATYFEDNRQVVSLDQISPYMQQAVVAIEDKRFYSHGGVDPRGLLRAALHNAQSDDTQGASTLTQQYVKNVLISSASRTNDSEAVAAAQEKSNARKLREAKLAIGLEKTMTKDEILEGYLNIAQFGNRVSGVEAAAHRYFGKSAADLSIVEAATIAGITQRPNFYDPTRNPENAEKRRNRVLKEMFEQRYITKEEYDTARSTPLADTLNEQSIQQGCVGAGGAAYFCDYVFKIITTDPIFGDTPKERKDLLYRGGLKIITTIDLNIQAAADDAVRGGLPVDNEYGFADSLVSVSPGSGEILAMAQNRDYNTDPDAPAGSTAINYGVDYATGGSTGFQAGSTFKAFTLAEWFNEGHTLLENVNANERNWKFREFTSCTQLSPNEEWKPRNSDGKGKGIITVEKATAASINTAYADMTRQLDLCKIAQTATDVGFRPGVAGTPIATYPSITLGVAETYPLAMANAYATFASGGVYCEPTAILSVERDGEPLAIPTADCRQVISTDTANAVTYALQRVLMPGGSAQKSAIPGRTAAGKTGTTNNNADAWFVGYTAELSTAVWMGHPDNKKVTMRNVVINGVRHPYVFGSTIPAPIWQDFMTRAVGGNPDVAFPDISTSAKGYVPPPAAPPARNDDGGSGAPAAGDAPAAPPAAPPATDGD